MGILLGGDKNVTQVDCSDDCVTLNVNFKWVNFKICGLYLNKAIFFKSICVEKNFYQSKKIAGLHLPTQLQPPKKKKKSGFFGPCMQRDEWNVESVCGNANRSNM